MIIGSEAFVLYSIAYGDTSLIVKMYTRERGLLSFMVKGAKGSKKNKKTALLQPLTLLDIQVSLRENKDLHHLRELRLLQAYSDIPFSPVKTAQSMFIAELLRKCIQEEEKNEALFDYVREAMLFLDSAPGDLPDFHLKFTLELARFLGFYPDDNFDKEHPFFQFTDGVFHHSFGETCLDAAASECLNRLMMCPLDELSELHFNRIQRQELSRNLINYFRWHLPSMGELQTPEVFAEVFG